MPASSISVTLTSRIPEITAKALAGISKAVEATLVAIEQDVKGGGPHAAPIRTGNLRRSYHHQMTGTAEGTVGNDMGIAPYAIYVEYGTYKMAAQPHITPATEAQKDPFVARCAAALKGE